MPPVIGAHTAEGLTCHDTTHKSTPRHQPERRETPLNTLSKLNDAVTAAADERYFESLREVQAQAARAWTALTADAGLTDPPHLEWVGLGAAAGLDPATDHPVTAPYAMTTLDAAQGSSLLYSTLPRTVAGQPQRFFLVMPCEEDCWRFESVPLRNLTDLKGLLAAARLGELAHDRELCLPELPWVVKR
jgi:hypothetical protein